MIVVVVVVADAAAGIVRVVLWCGRLGNGRRDVLQRCRNETGHIASQGLDVRVRRHGCR